MNTLPQVVFQGYDTKDKCWKVLINGEIPIDKVAPIEDGDEKDPDPIVRVFMPLKRKYIAEEGACIAPYPPIRYEQGGNHTISIGFAVDYRVKDEDSVMTRFLDEFVKELETYIKENFFEKASLPEII